jgi:hypothetical protein
LPHKHSDSAGSEFDCVLLVPSEPTIATDGPTGAASFALGNACTIPAAKGFAGVALPAAVVTVS